MGVKVSDGPRRHVLAPVDGTPRKGGLSTGNAAFWVPAGVLASGTLAMAAG